MSRKMMTIELTELQREIMADAFQREVTDTLIKFAEAGLDLCDLTDVIVAILIRDHLEASGGDLQHAIDHIISHTSFVSMMFYEKLAMRNVAGDNDDLDQELENKPKKPTFH